MSILTQFDAFLAADTAPSRALRAVLADFTTGTGETTEILGHAILGGAVRDINTNGASANPRDFDVVVLTSIGKLRSLMKKYGDRKANAFNGYNFTVEGVRFDLWALRETYAIRKSGNPEPTFADLMPTTFFNLEAVAYEFVGKAATEPTFPNPPRVVHDGGYAQAIVDSKLELNNSRNPLPVLQLVRACGFVKRLGLTIGPNLQDWILENWKAALMDDRLAAVQSKYYGAGNEPCTPAELRTTLDTAIAAAAARQGVPVPVLPPPGDPNETPNPPIVEPE
jgi:hypothetical protein